MKIFRRTNLILTAVLLFITCSVAFAQDKQTDKQKNKESEQKKQKEVFDASTATLEETQEWLRKTLVKYRPPRSHMEKIEFNGCEISYANSYASWNSGHTPSTPIPFRELGDTSLMKNIESMRATDFRTFISDYSEFEYKTKVNLSALDADKTRIVNIGVFFGVSVFTHTDSKENAVTVEMSRKEAPSQTQDKSPSAETKYTSKTTNFAARDKKIANQLKDALVRIITLCRQ